VVVEIIVTAVVVLVFYLCWRWFVDAVRMNYLDRRMYIEPPTGGPWVQPRSPYEDSAH
jgi:hypothetical protein